jgi:DNA-binding NtrC family response regulator
VFPVEIPPLRQRKEDISHIVEVILNKLNKSHQKEVHDIHSDVLEAFRSYSWPGNIRELENLLERAYIVENASMLTSAGFPNELFVSASPSPSELIDSSRTLAEIRRKGIEDIERRYLRELLARNRGKIKDSAEAAGITTRQLHKLLTKYGIRKEDFKSNSSHK